MSLKEWLNRMKETNPNLEQLQEKIKQFVGGGPGVRGPGGGHFGAPRPEPPHFGHHGQMPPPYRNPYVNRNWGAFSPDPPPFEPSQHGHPTQQIPDNWHEHESPYHRSLPDGNRRMSGMPSWELHQRQMQPPQQLNDWPPVFPPEPPPFTQGPYDYPPQGRQSHGVPRNRLSGKKLSGVPQPEADASLELIPEPQPKRTRKPQPKRTQLKRKHTVHRSRRR